MASLCGPGLAVAETPPHPQTEVARALSFPPTLPGVRDPKAPLQFEADELGGEAGVNTVAKGRVRVRQGDLTVRADELEHTQADNTARARGNVRVVRDGSIFVGPSVTLKLDTLEGSFESPRYWLARTQAGGTAERIEFKGENRLSATGTTYTSCTPENTASGDMGQPAWALRTRQIDLDFEANEGRAEGAVIEFQGVPILAAPTLTFPLNDQRKSGWLPPSVTFDSKSGLEVSTPYYWNIAPDRDATLAPTVASRRGVGLDAEFRYLAPSDAGELRVFGLPDDRLANRHRGQFNYQHQGSLTAGDSLSPTQYTVQWQRVSDDDYWKDFGQTIDSDTPRLLDSHVRVQRLLNERNWGLGDSQTELYAQVQSWQTLKDLDLDAPADSQIGEPYRREPQMGVRSRGLSDAGLEWDMRLEFNRFVNPDRSLTQGNRLHGVAQVARQFDFNGVYVRPKLMWQGTTYDLDRQGLSTAPRTVSRGLPTVSVDAGMTLDRPVQYFGRNLVQTLEPRILYVRTPYRDQSDLPLFDSAPRDFNQYAIYSENDFTGVDRISDANQVTIGVNSRLLDEASGAELMRFGVVQKMLLADQRINPNGSEPITSRFSDLMLLGSSTVIPSWYLDGTLQYSTEEARAQQGTIGVRYTPGQWRTVSTVYRYTRDGASQVELGWQWPIGGRQPTARQMIAQQPLSNASGLRAPASCGGAWYSVGRVAYSTRESRFINTLMGLEYDAGCWIGRVVAERVAIGQSDATVRIMFQLELVGLSRLSLGANPLRTLKDNIPGYSLLREEGEPLPASPSPLHDPDD